MFAVQAPSKYALFLVVGFAILALSAGTAKVVGAALPLQVGFALALVAGRLAEVVWVRRISITTAWECCILAVVGLLLVVVDEVVLVAL